MMQSKSSSRSDPQIKGAPQAPHTQPPHECEVCGVRFAKAAKRDVHLLDVHSAHFGLSPRALSPSASGGVGHTVSRAVTEANLAFSAIAGTKRSSAVCALCPNSSTTFKNPRDLAQHILSKHSDDTFKTEASAVSCRMAPPPAKRAKLMSKKVKKGGSPPPRSGNLKRKEPPAPAPSGMKPPLSPKGASSRAGSLSPRAGSSSPRARSPPKKVAIVDPSNKSSVNKDQSCSQASAAADRLSVPMDFSAIVGFTSNAHKSYYRLPKR